MTSVSAGHFVLGTEGLALLRTWLLPRGHAERVAELAQFAAAPDAPPLSIRFDVPELDVRAGYARWAGSYDSAPNPLIRAEEPAVRAIIDRLPVGRALDAACGTGRHTAYLRDRGHRVSGVDATPEMLDRARTRVPEAELRIGDLAALPLDDASVDLAVCALALTHVPDLTRPIAELSRVVRPGGRIVLSDLHPTMVLLGTSGFFIGTDGAAGNVRTYHHPQSSYLAAFRAAGLEVVDCVEPVVEEQDLVALSGGLLSLAEEAFRAAWVGLPNALVWELKRV
jgi:ubiquinone/menaquinone biosynthesis C-methylase UbiE